MNVEVRPHAPRMCLVAPEFLGPFQNGGVGTACYWQAVTLAQSGYALTVLYTGATERESPAHWTRTFPELEGFAYVDLWEWARSTSADTRALETAHHDLRAAQLVFEYLREHDFDLILFQEFLGHGARALQARESGFALQRSQTVVTLHSSRRWIYEGSGQLPATRDDVVVDFLERESARLADRVVAPSRHMARWAVERWRIGRDIDVVPNCYDTRMVGPRRMVTHRGPFTHLVFFGRLETRKGLHLFVRALASSTSLRTTLERVTFLGRHARVEQRPSEEFLADARAAMPWLQLDVRNDLGSHEALAWLERQPDTLAVAPSLADNLPYALVELHARGIPFVSTDVGGIPEIVGPANRHQLAAPTVEGLRDVLERVATDGLTVDYRDGYHQDHANRQQRHLVHEVLTTDSVPAVSTPPDRLTVVVTDAFSETDLNLARASAAIDDVPSSAVRWCTLNDWKRLRGTEPALFVSRSVSLTQGCTTALLRAIGTRRVDAATSFAGPEAHGEAFLGASPEIGWRSNCFGGPCFMAGAEAFAVLDDVVRHGFTFWSAYAAIVCRGLRLAMIPAVLYDIGREHATVSHETERVLSHYTDAWTGAVDLGWTLKTVLPLGVRTAMDPSTTHASVDARSPARALYERLVATPDDLLCGYATEGPREEPFWSDLASLRVRLAPMLHAWNAECPRVFIYGAGVHTRLLLAAFPDLGRFVRGFIDRRPLGTFLKRPSVVPSEFRAAMADVILYSSREFERDMYAAMAHHAVAHVLLYSAFESRPFANESAVAAFPAARPA